MAWIKQSEGNYKTDDGFYEASITWDGCVNFWNHHTLNGETLEPEQSDYQHICSLPKFIEMLQELEPIRQEVSR